MRWTLVLSLFAVTAFAQSSPGVEATTPPAVSPEYRAPIIGRYIGGSKITLLSRALPATEQQRCSIPLLNMLSKEAAQVDQEMILTMPPKGDSREYSMLKATVPAPSCDDAKR
jgi:hypothetical protein